MNDEKSSAANPNPPRIEIVSAPPLPAERPPSYWIKKFLYCNPFYLASAALLLFGLFRMSVDSEFQAREVAQLTFNFTSLQCYELLLVGTAMLLARRMIWYDAKLLVTMENLLVLVPFLLLNQAALIKREIVWVFCGAAALFAIGRSVLAQRGVAALRFPGRLTLIGICVLAVNSVWPIVYRYFHERKFGKNLEAGDAFITHELGWFIVLPALVALANLLPRPREDGKSPVQGRRFPIGLFTLWVLGTAVHLYALGYIYDFNLHREWLAPTLWVLAWTIHFRLPDYIENLAPAARKLTFVLPLLVPLVAACATGSNAFFSLNLLNLFIYARTIWYERDHVLARHLAMITIAALVASVPAPLFQNFTGWFERDDLLGIAVLAYVMISAVLTRNPKAAIAGSIAAGVAMGALHHRANDTIHWALQAGIVFFLLHSLRWRDYDHQGAAGARIFMAAWWLIHSLFWVHDAAAFWHPLATAGAVLVVCVVRGLIFQRWTPLVVPGCAVFVSLCGPVDYLIAQLRSAPLGVVAILGSFVLFAVGTALALTKHRWHKTDDANI